MQRIRWGRLLILLICINAWCVPIALMLAKTSALGVPYAYVWVLTTSLVLYPVFLVFLLIAGPGNVHFIGIALALGGSMNMLRHYGIGWGIFAGIVTVALFAGSTWAMDRLDPQIRYIGTPLSQWLKN